VAKRVGITPMAIYRHFDSKEALLDALVLDGLARWSARVNALPLAEGLAKINRSAKPFLISRLKSRAASRLPFSSIQAKRDVIPMISWRAARPRAPSS